MSLSSDGKTIYSGHLTIPFGFGIWRAENAFKPWPVLRGSLMHEPVKRWENHLFRII
jgi:hypothetical protein